MASLDQFHITVNIWYTCVTLVMKNSFSLTSLLSRASYKQSQAVSGSIPAESWTDWIGYLSKTQAEGGSTSACVILKRQAITLHCQLFRDVRSLNNSVLNVECFQMCLKKKKKKTTLKGLKSLKWQKRLPECLLFLFAVLVKYLFLGLTNTDCWMHQSFYTFSLPVGCMCIWY